jgi:heptaprenyl diphosphate synthase
MKTGKMVQLALLISGAAVLHVVESWIPMPLPVPGAKLGLANVVTLAVVLRFGLREAIIVSAMRSFLGALLGGTFLTVGFFLSFSGAVVSALTMGALYRALGSRIGATGLSLLGAVTHNVTQLLVASLLVAHFGLFVHLPVLLFFALPTGYFVGALGSLLYRHMPRW